MESQSNQQLQTGIFRDNAKFLFEDLKKKGVFSGVPDIRGINANRALLGRLEANNLGGIRKVEMDLISLDLLADNGYNFSDLEKDIIEISGNMTGAGMRSTDFFEVLEKFRKESIGPTDLSVKYPQILKDAILSQKSGGVKPPAEDMQKAVIYVADKAFNTLQSNPNQ